MYIYRCFHCIMYEAPLIVILGATGAGKSKLALDISKRLNGEIVSGDSMQVYRGLDIVTNKVTPAEQTICNHHLIGFLSPLEEYSIVDFKRQALNAIKEIQSRRKLPILCGGTNYYIESILWEFLTPTRHQQENDLAGPDVAYESIRNLESLDSVELHRMLEEIDPDRSAKIHPNDRRKVIRSIEVYHQSGKKHSELLKIQTGERPIGGSLLFKNTCLILVDCDREVLYERIASRVDKMIESGLLNELKTFHEEYNRERLEKREEIDYEHGIFQSIGFKEFHEYLTKELLNESRREKMLEDSIERMKLSTRQYAKYQRKWITKRIINRQGGLPVYAVDSTDPTLWNEKVLYPALKTLRKAVSWGEWVDGINKNSDVFSSIEVTESNEIKPATQTEQNTDLSSRVKRECKICGGKIFLTDHQWQTHISARKHKNAVVSHKRKQFTTLNILLEHEKRKSLETENVNKNAAHEPKNESKIEDDID